MESRILVSNIWVFLLVFHNVICKTHTDSAKASEPFRAFCVFFLCTLQREILRAEQIIKGNVCA